MKTWKVILIVTVMMILYFMLLFWSVANYGLEGGGNMMFMREEILEKDGTKGNEQGICCRFRRDAV